MDFKLPQIEASIQKFEEATEQVFSSESPSGYVNSLDSLLNLVDRDQAISHIFLFFKGKIIVQTVDQWLKENSKSRSSLTGAGSYELPRKIPERIVFVYRFL